MIVPSMTKRHFELIASVIKDAPIQLAVDRDIIALRLADIFAATNKNFDSAKFIYACGVR